MSGCPRIAAHYVAVLHDEEGLVLHLHRFVVAEGGAEPTEERRTEIAVEAARTLGHEADTFLVLHFPGDDVPEGHVHRVDTRTGTLLSDPPPPRRPRRS